MKSSIEVVPSKTLSGRDEFTSEVKETVAKRVSYLCSNPDCRASTIGPKMDEAKPQNVGTASHITAAAPGGPRYNPALSSSERKHYRNAIWLCRTCGTMVDNDYHRYPVELLQGWKRQSEEAAQNALGKPTIPTVSPLSRSSRMVEAAQSLSELTVCLWNELYSFVANNFDTTPNDEWRQLRRSINDFADAISVHEWLFSTTVINAARDVHDFYSETLCSISKSNAHRSYDNRMTTTGAEIRGIASNKFVEEDPALRTKLTDALRVDLRS